MIIVKVTRNQRRNVEAVEVSGHADFANAGNDIVCAAVSAVVFGMINAVEKLLFVKMNVEIDSQNKGLLYCRVPVSETMDETLSEKIQLLMEAMLSTIDDISKNYAKHVRLDDNM